MAAPACPFLGLKDDPETKLEFPAGANFCHHAKPVGPVQLDYQRSVCLTDSHAQCPVYLRRTLGPLPGHVLAPQEGIPPVIKGMGALAGFLVLFAVLLAFGGLDSVLAGLGWRPSGPDVQPVVVPVIPSDTPFQPVPPVPMTGSTEEDPAEAVDTPVVILPATDTIEPTAVVCIPPAGWVVYDVKPTDSLLRLSLIYGLEVADLQAANCMGEETIIRPGDQIYVPQLPTATPTMTPSPTVRVIYFTAAPTEPPAEPPPPSVPPTSAPPPPTQAPSPTQAPPTQPPPTQPPPTQAPTRAPTEAP